MLLEKYGEIVDLIVLKCKASQRGKGCGFCTYASRDSALAAIEALHEKYVFADSKNPLQVKFADAESVARDRRVKLFVGQLPKSVDESALSRGFQAYGRISGCQVLRKGEHSRGCGFVVFEDRHEAEAAITALNGTFLFEDQQAPLNVRVAENAKDRQHRKRLKGREAQMMQQIVPNVPMINPINTYAASLPYPQEFQMPYPMMSLSSPEQFQNMQIMQYINMRGQQHPPYGARESGRPQRGPQDCNLFIFNIPYEWNDQILAEVFMPFGKVLSSKVYIDWETKKSKGFGFVSYDSPQAAELAIMSMHDYILPNGKALKVSLKKDQRAIGSPQSSQAGAEPEDNE